MSRASAAGAGTRRIVLCADDFALHAGVSRGIVALARRQRLSATSAMVLSPRWREDAAALRELRGTLDVGLHLDWTSRFALQAGHGLSLGAALLRGATLGFAPARARAVMARQLDAFEQHWGAAPDHIDGHQHVQQFDGIRQALVALVAQRYGPAAPYLRVSRPQRGLSDVKSQVIAAMGARGLQRLARGAGLGCASLLGGVYDFGGDAAAYALRMDGWLQAAPEGLLLMCHPADAPEPGDDVGAARVHEYAHLASASFAAQLAHHGVALVRGAALYGGTLAPKRPETPQHIGLPGRQHHP